MKKFFDWYNTDWVVKRGVYLSLWLYFWFAMAASISTLILSN